MLQAQKFENIKIDSIKLSPPESISSGYSGSPVICQTTNNVIGIVNIQLGQNTNYAICAKHLLEIYPKLQTEDSKLTQSIRGKVKIISSLSEQELFLISHYVDQAFDDSLQSYSTQSKNWVEPQLYSIVESNSEAGNHKYKIDIDSIINHPRNIEITSPQQYGSTCLAHYLIQKAWKCVEKSFWLYLDINDLKPYSKQIKKTVEKQLKKIKLEIKDVECIVLDEYSNSISDVNKKLEELSALYKDIPIIVMKKQADNPLLESKVENTCAREYETLYLWSLPRTSIRKLVKQYNNEIYIEKETTVVNKVISDLEAINIPRTPQNCLTLLKISELNFDDSPVNRAEMMHRVLSLLFNFDDIPTYKRRPDLKDTEHILGYFCAEMLITKIYYFTRESFIEKLNRYCTDNEIDLEVHLIFDILCRNTILVERDSQFHFKFSFWIFYFAAHRMLHSTEFLKFIMTENCYLSYPEIIEFYSGIDRQRDDLLETLSNDLEEIKNTVIHRCGLPEDFNIFDYAKWLPSEDSVAEMNKQITEGVLNSNLPDEVNVVA